MEPLLLLARCSAGEIVHILEDSNAHGAPVADDGLGDFGENEWGFMDAHGQVVKLVIFPAPFEAEEARALFRNFDVEEGIGNIDKTTMCATREELAPFLPYLLQLEFTFECIWYQRAAV